jgi:pimeloyl-ACP methyl ester carboxylesterase
VLRRATQLLRGDIVGRPLTTSSQEEQIREESLWFSAPDRPLFGKLTTPLGARARGGVLLSPPIGRESRQARRALRYLALYLAIDGYASIRYDHFGTGDSSGSIEDDEIDQAWIEGVCQGVDFLRSLGIAAISAVGMRMGATIVGTAAADYDLGLSSFVMWDPCESGRSYVREINALGALRPTDITDDNGEPTKMVEYPLSDQASGRITRFTLLGPSPRALADRVLVVTRDDRPVSNKFRGRWSSQDVDWTTTSEQGPMLEALLTTMVQPTSSIAEIRTWLTEPGLPTTPLANVLLSRDAIVMKGTNTFPVKETVVELEPNGLFGVVSEPVSGANGPLIVMVNGVNEDHVGPARLWVELSRQWAGLGLRCVRFDSFQRGESPWLPSKGELTLLEELRPQDLRDAVRALSPSISDDTVLIGYCNGAQLALGVALELKTRGVCAIVPQLGARLFLHVDASPTSDRESVRSLMQRLEGLLQRHGWLDGVIRASIRTVVTSKIGSRTMFGAFKLTSVSTPKMRAALKKNGTDALLILSPEDFSVFQRAPIIGALLRRRHKSSEKFQVEIIPGLDHSFLSVLGRDRAVAILNQHILERFTVASALPNVGQGNAALGD